MKATMRCMRPFWISLGAILGIIISFWLYFPAQGRDLGQWSDYATDSQVREWYQNLMQPDNPTISCCGLADAYWADGFEVSPNGEYVAIITDERGVPGRPSIKPGTKIVVPNNKIKWDKGNPTGHGVIFLRFSDDEDEYSEPSVYCYVAPLGV